jgi:hypothetical protein
MYGDPKEHLCDEKKSNHEDWRKIGAERNLVIKQERTADLLNAIRLKRRI